MDAFFTTMVKNARANFTALADGQNGEIFQSSAVMDRDTSPLRRARLAAGLSMPKLGKMAETSAPP